MFATPEDTGTMDVWPPFVHSIPGLLDSVLRSLFDFRQYEAPQWSDMRGEQQELSARDKIFAEVGQRIGLRWQGIAGTDTREIDRGEMFVRGVNSYVASGNVQAGIVAVYDQIGDLFVGGQLDECDRILRKVDTDTTDADVLLSFLMATAPAPSDQLPSRGDFYRRVRTRFDREFGEDRSAQLLNALE
jgi:hypothetical protein